MDLTGLLSTAERLAAEGAEIATRLRTTAIDDVSTKSTPTDLVTAADRAVERHIAARLAQLRPSDCFVGEEYGQSGNAASRVRWVVDPIDGTVNYVFGLPLYAVSIAAEVDGDVAVAVVRSIPTGAVWKATRGGGAWRGGRRLRGSTPERLDLALVCTGFGYSAELRAEQGLVLSELLPRIRNVRTLGSAALGLCAVAEGSVDAYFEKGLSDWDFAAGVLIAREAGLTVTGLRGDQPGSEMLIVAPASINEPLHSLLATLV